MSDSTSVRTARIPIVLCVDVEPDARMVDDGGRTPWSGFERTGALLGGARPALASRTGADAHYTWCLRMDPQIQRAYGHAAWVTASYSAAMTAIAGAGDDIGLHVHAFRWREAWPHWVADHGDPEWIDHCLDMAFAAFDEALGRRCETFRFGDRWMSQAAFARLDALGVRYELTPEPGLGPEPAARLSDPFTGSLPDYRGVPSLPYRPSPVDYRRPGPDGGRGLRVVPVTTAPVRPSLLRRLQARWTAPDRSLMVATALLSHHPSLFRRIVSHALARAVPHLVTILQSGAMATPRYARRVATNLETLQAHPQSARFAWVTPAEATAMLGL